MDQEKIKERIAEKALSFVKDGMIIGLGTGTTASAFINKLGDMLSKKKMKIMTVASSVASENLATSLNIPCTSINLVSHIDITFDGADEIDEKKRLIKGAGGALLREKIVAMASSEFVILIEEKKCSHSLGKSLLPVEILPFGYLFTIKHLTKLGFNGKLRMKTDKTPYITDNNNYIIDITLSFPCNNPEKEEMSILSVPGVIDTGFFLTGIRHVIIGKPTGEILVL